MIIDSTDATTPTVPLRLVWWPAPQFDTEVPRRHGLGWAFVDGEHHGHLAVPVDRATTTATSSSSCWLQN